MMKQYKITLLKGDGIGPEIVDEAVKVLNKTAEKRGFSVAYEEAELGGIAIDHTGVPSGGNYSKMQSIRFGSVRSRGRSQMGESAGQQPSGGWTAWNPRGAGAVCQSAPGGDL